MGKKPVTVTNGLDAILAGSLVRSKHILFLYTSHVDKYAVQASFFAMSKVDEKLLYITGEQPGLIMGRFGKLNLNLLVVHPENIGTLKTMDGKLRIIMDMGSVDEGHERLEEFLIGYKNNIALCTYDLSRLPPERIQKLAMSHDRLILNTPDLTVLSSEKLDVAEATIERFVKDYLDIVVLALIAGKPMCGTDVVDIVHRNFNVLLSPGTIYPLLHRLKKEGLLECECRIKKKIYKPAKGSEASIRSILDEQLLANEFLNSFLKSRCLTSKKDEELLVHQSLEASI